MELHFKELTIDSQQELAPYFELRSLTSCEYNFNTLFIWAKINTIEYAITPNFAVFSEVYNGRYIHLMPLCKEEYFKEAFETIKEYFTSKGLAFGVFVTDKVFKDFIEKEYPEQYEIAADRDLFDYLYDANGLRTLVGKKYNKKRNHLNAFHQEYDGRYEYKRLSFKDKEDVCHLLRGWKEQKDQREEGSEAIEEELGAICRVFNHLDQLDIRVGGIYIDGRLQAMSIGSYINGGKEANIHVEKANDEIRGLYPLINQEFLLHEFPDVELVNREEDLGIEGLRKAKLSYYPIEILEKFSICEKQ